MNQAPIQTELDRAEQLFAQGRRKEAVDIWRDVLRHSPQEFGALHMLGIVAQQEGSSELALRFFEAAIGVQPGSAAAWLNRAIVLRKQNRDDDALHSARMAIEAHPELAEAWDMCGQILKEQAHYPEAEGCHSLAITLQPTSAAFHNNYALLLLAIDDQPAAYKALRQAETLDANFPPLLLGNILRSMGHPEPAATCFARARSLMPDYREATASEAMAHLQMGDFANGWALWEQRPDMETSLHKVPLWQGQNVSSLLLYEDQGLGDALQFLRFVPQLMSQADNIYLRTREPLHRLCAENFPRVIVLRDNEPLPHVDARCRLSSLPHHFNTRIDTIPNAPYLAADPARRALWREKLAMQPTPRIGIIWAGNAQFHNDRFRSLSFDALRPLLACGQGHFISLQKDRPEAEQTRLFNAALLLDDFSDTAALIAELDMIVTVDTAVAHLAGALGKPVFILLPFDSDWRWLLAREDSPWYPTARLYRQTKPRDWSNVIEAVTRDIRKFIAGDKTVLSPSPWHGECLRQNPHALSLPT